MRANKLSTHEFSHAYCFKIAKNISCMFSLTNTVFQHIAEMLKLRTFLTNKAACDLVILLKRAFFLLLQKEIIP